MSQMSAQDTSNWDTHRRFHRREGRKIPKLGLRIAIPKSNRSGEDPGATVAALFPRKKKDLEWTRTDCPAGRDRRVQWPRS